MVTFFIKYIRHTEQFTWTCYAANNRELFKAPYTIAGRQAPRKLRNCVNHVRTIGAHLKSYDIHITAEANAKRKELKEPLYGCFAPTER